MIEEFVEHACLAQPVEAFPHAVPFAEAFGQGAPTDCITSVSDFRGYLSLPPCRGLLKSVGRAPPALANARFPKASRQFATLAEYIAESQIASKGTGNDVGVKAVDLRKRPVATTATEQSRMLPF